MLPSGFISRLFESSIRDAPLPEVMPLSSLTAPFAVSRVRAVPGSLPLLKFLTTSPLSRVTDNTFPLFLDTKNLAFSVVISTYLSVSSRLYFTSPKSRFCTVCVGRSVNVPPPGTSRCAAISVLRRRGVKSDMRR